jgi:radical SAM protein with 4Fe4S-binding SPASM domain
MTIMTRPPGAADLLPVTPAPMKPGALGRVQVEQVADAYVVSQPDIGALSSLGPLDFAAFHLFAENPGDLGPVESLYAWAGDDVSAAAARSRRLAARLERDGWLRHERPSHNAAQRLQQVYFTITRECDLACPYCYQGLRNRRSKTMPLADAQATLAKIAAFNPDCHIIVTGGEPLMHPEPFAIFDTIERHGLPFGLLCNGSLIDDDVAARLAEYRRLRRVQISLDGMTAEVHGLTRGRASFDKAMAAIDHIVRHDIPLIVAPTIHHGNAHQIADMAVFAARKGAWFSPNNLRVFPHDENDGKFSLDNETLRGVVGQVRQRLYETFAPEHLEAIERRARGPSVCSVSAPNANFICGTGHSLLDIDWNGEVYPCHLLKDRGLILGNIFEQSFEDIYRKSAELGIRVPSFEIPKCGGCKFTSRCGGGCRAGAFYAYGSLAREDDLCEVNYASQMQRAVREASSP